MVAIAQHFGRPHTPTDQAWIASLFGHIKGEWPHLDQIDDPAVLRAELERARTQYNTVRLHEGIGYVTPTTSTRDAAPRSAKPDATGWNAHASSASATIEHTNRRSLAMRTNQPAIRVTKSDTCHRRGERRRLRPACGERGPRRDCAGVGLRGVWTADPRGVGAVRGAGYPGVDL